MPDMNCNCVECRVLRGEASSGEVFGVIKSWRKDRKRSFYWISDALGMTMDEVKRICEH